MAHLVFVRSHLFGCMFDTLGPSLRLHHRSLPSYKSITLLHWDSPLLPSALPPWPLSCPTSDVPHWTREGSTIVGTLHDVSTDFIHQNGPNTHTAIATGTYVSNVDLRATNHLSAIRFRLNVPVVNILARLLDQNKLPNKRLLKEAKTEERLNATTSIFNEFARKHGIAQATKLKDAQVLLDPTVYSRFLTLRHFHKDLTSQLRGCHALRESIRDCLDWARHQGEAPFSFMHYRDWRLRSYASGGCWNYQGNDLHAALLFEDRRPLGPAGWGRLRGYLGGVAGDQKDWPERMAWTTNHHDDLMAVAAEPLAHHALWSTWDEPVKALAAALEYAAAITSGTPEGYLSALPVGLDATTSVAQHLVLLLRHAPLAATVNLIDGPTRGDLYRDVLACAVDKLRVLHPGYGLDIPELTRSMAKRVVMTGLYGSPKLQQYDRIRSILVEEGYDPTSNEIGLLTTALWDALQETLPVLRTIRTILSKIARLRAKAGLPMTWTVPTGSRVQQAYWKSRGKRFSCTYKGATTTRQAVLEKPGSGFMSKQCSAITANFVHSLDASVVSFAVNGCFEVGLPCFTTHDCFYSHAATSHRMYDIVRRAYVKVHAGSPLSSNFFMPAVLPKGYPSPPVLGTLRLEEVAEATRIIL